MEDDLSFFKSHSSIISDDAHLDLSNEIIIDKDDKANFNDNRSNDSGWKKHKKYRNSRNNSRKNIYQIKKSNKFCRKKFEKEFEILIDDLDREFSKEIVEYSKKRRFGRFDHQLGQGAQKRVYSAYDFDEGKEVAWNCISTESMSNHELELVLEEITMLKQLDHPNIIKYISGWIDKEKKEIVLITEAFSGGSLKK